MSHSNKTPAPRLFTAVAFVDEDRRGRTFTGRSFDECQAKLDAWKQRRRERQGATCLPPLLRGGRR